MRKHYTLIIIVLSTIAGLTTISGKTDHPATVETFSISLNVKDIAASKTFYEKLGFTPVANAGGLAQKWMLMENGAAKIGLFQGFFPENTITLNPDDARSIYKKITRKGIETTYSAGIDKEEGPASFALTDPDGNSILVDQH
jgi:catechol 2,3-dioxygenase-like lactoylglutathione lyase family enzyme